MVLRGENCVKNRILLILVLVFIFQLCLIGCYNEHRGCIDVPDKIIVYSEGKQKVIEKSNKKTDNIVKIANKRFNQKVFNIKKDVSEELINKRKNDALSIEFIYLQEHEMDIIGNGVKPFRYTRLFFPIQMEGPRNEEECFMYYGDGRKYFDNPIANLYYNEDLVNVLWDLK
ncbi:hypothetical protein B9W14_16755 [Clostridium drakei]|uniref:Uncharacterized protein n=1 Tax=Clostridium drakei TaxID=332101 RepID=A0A2U8DYJ0_9CLOT|nr:hypothetical protein B9W14_16755 [Clostridium drakei]